jgi:hypothetical protein
MITRIRRSPQKQHLIQAEAQAQVQANDDGLERITRQQCTNTCNEQSIIMRLIKRSITLFKILAGLIVINLMLSLTIGVPPLNSNSERNSNSIAGALQQRQVDVQVNNTNSNNTNNTSHRVVFYNVYINPESGTSYRMSLKIVDEQLKIIPNHTRIFYFHIGGKRHKNICSNYPQLHCTCMEYKEQGGEDLTLQAMWKYCQRHQTHRVTYLHDKGSFRRSAGNTRNRRRTTRGALSEECLQMPSHLNCNVCGAKLQVMPHLIYQSNMWTAECSYIRQLLPPSNYMQTRQILLRKLYSENDCLSQTADDTMADTSWSWNLSDPLFLRNVGLGRYALERWMTSHPSFRPCEVWNNGIIGMNDYSNLTLGDPSEWGKMVSKKIKARQSWLLQQEYAAFYPNTTTNSFLAKDQSNPKARPCWL